jgi:RNA polymerase sigma-70 factor (ECF subfamily)
MDTTQTQLLWAVRDAGDRDAWINFYGIYAPMVKGFVRRTGLPDSECDDVTQEIMLAAQDALEKGIYQPEKGRFRAWLFGVARRQAMMAHRARHRRTRAQSPTGGTGSDPLARVADRGDEADRLIWDQEWRYALLARALEQVRAEVGEKPYQAFVGFAVERRGVEVVAEELGLSASSVYVYKSRVLEAVKAWVERFEDDRPNAECGMWNAE